MARFLVPLLLALFVSPLPAGIVYLLDDGSAENSVGWGYTGGTMGWANQFTVQAGGETITRIRIAFGFRPANIPAGYPLTAYLWSDPNNDGNPADRVVLASAAGLTADVGTNTFVPFDITPVTLNAGASFFVGAVMFLEPGGKWPAAIDRSTSQTRSWVWGGPIIGSNPARIDSLLPGNWLVRADAVGAVPEPGTFLLLGSVLAGLVLLRRR